MLWDAVLNETSQLFLEDLSPEERDDCRQTILEELCLNPSPDSNPSRRTANYFPHRTDVIECAIGAWYFRYVILNTNTIAVATINYGPSNPKHPYYT